jgi:hypothetical protein
MWYQLVLITNLGAITPLAMFNDLGACLKERAPITKTAQYSAECLPTQSPEEVKKQMQAHLKMMNELLQDLQRTQK